VPDDVRPGTDVQRVGKAIKPVVLARIAQVEDVLGDDANLADARARGLELGEGRNAAWRLCASLACPGQGGEANEQETLN
jgi:hypothetical protein